MKIVDRKTFLSMPPETLFSKYTQSVFGDIAIKLDTLPYNDFVVQELADAVACSGSEEFIRILDDAKINGTSFKMDFNCAGRDGLFDEDQLFVVWEKEDVRALIERLSKIQCGMEER